MNRTLVRFHAEEGVTVPEVLVLVIVLFVLAALLFPFIRSPSERRNKVAAELLVIVHAVGQYEFEYGHFPKLNPAASEPLEVDESAGDSAAGMAIHNAALFNTLRDLDCAPNLGHSQNPRQQVYVEARAVANNAAPNGGFLDVAGSTGSQGSWFDPSGSEYNVVIDSNGDGVINVAAFYEDFKATDAPRVKVGVFSLGKDKKLGKAGDRKYKSGNDYSDDRVSWTSR